MKITRDFGAREGDTIHVNHCAVETEEMRPIVTGYILKRFDSSLLNVK